MFESVEAVAGDGVPAGLWCLSNEALLDELGAAGVELSRVQARWWGLLAEAERRGAAMEVHEVSTSGLLTSGNSHTARAARAEVRLATELRAVPEVARALASGGLSTDQARGIVQGLSVLPADVPDADRRAAAAHLVELAAEHGPDELRRLAHHVVAVLSPDTVEEADRAAVERADRLASRDRYLSWTRDGDHGLVVRGSLPAVAGEQLVEVLSAISARARAAVAVSGERLSRAQANADALGVLVEHALSCGVAPVHGADRPRVVVTVDHDVLVGRVAGTGLLVGSGVPLTAEQARLVACDAGVLPVVMGGGSVPLDVGRERRLFTGTQRAFLVVRDQGCAFPACDRRPAECEAHHIVPWWAGGATDVGNAALLCRHHHRLVEPDPARSADRQWAVRFDAHGRLEFGTPVGTGGAPPGRRRWRQHHRYHHITTEITTEADPGP